MFNSIALRLKCPHCGHSLMNPDHLLDGQPSVEMGIAIAGKKGTIRLSSIYGSYALECDIPLIDQEIAVFSCPHCGKNLPTDETCGQCLAPMTSLHLLEGGRVAICSRKGCKKHSIEFEDLNVALEHFYHDFAYSGKTVLVGDDTTKPPIDAEALADKEILESGTYLQSYCPHCRNSLIEHNQLKLKVIDRAGAEGYLMLSPYLNVFTHASTIKLPDNSTVGDIKCWHCDHSLMVPEKACPRCGAEVAMIQVAAMSKMVDFYICSKKGCTWHGISDSDLQKIILEDSREW
jgi:predicted RNA-binding Zn-ribbon protein involved in translation (DUF1610 family)